MGGLGPIPFSSIDTYASRIGIEGGDQFDRLCRIIQAMDRAFLKYQSEEAGKRETNTKNGRNS